VGFISKRQKKGNPGYVKKDKDTQRVDENSSPREKNGKRLTGGEHNNGKGRGKKKQGKERL